MTKRVYASRSLDEFTNIRLQSDDMESLREICIVLIALASMRIFFS